MEEPLFAELRSKQQLGYDVQLNRKFLAGVHGLSFTIQSSDHSPVYLQKQLFQFIDDFYYNLFDREKFEKFKSGTIQRKKMGYRNLAEEHKYLFEILSNFDHKGSQISWNRTEREVKLLEEVCTYEEVKKFYE